MASLVHLQGPVGGPWPLAWPAATTTSQLKAAQAGYAAAQDDSLYAVPWIHQLYLLW